MFADKAATARFNAEIGRLQGIDICRSIAIILAMFSHALVEFKLSYFLGEYLVPLHLVTAIATPVFICLFGAMLELAYCRKVQDGRIEAATSRLLERAAQCYVLYALTVLAYVGVGDYSLGFALRCLLLIGATPYTDILKFYCLVLASAPLLIALRLRFGLIPVALAGVTIHLLYPLIAMIPSPPLIEGKDYIGMGTRFFVGVGKTIVGGPSLLHGLSMVLFGMLVGRAMVDIGQPSSAVRSQGWTLLAGMAVFFIAASAILWDWSHSAVMVNQIANMTLRNENHPLYAALGLAATMLSVMACTYLFDLRRIRSLDWIKFIGTVSLFTFAFGNILLIVQPWRAGSAEASIALTLLFGTLIALQSYLFLKLMRSNPAAGGWFIRSAAALVQFLTNSSTNTIRKIVEPLVPRYSRLVEVIAPHADREALLPPKPSVS